jgi:hypothetical protein
MDDRYCEAVATRKHLLIIDLHSARTVCGKYFVTIYPNSATGSRRIESHGSDYTTTPFDVTCAECADLLKRPADIGNLRTTLCLDHFRCP